jgi:precorrin-6B methylase 2
VVDYTGLDIREGVNDRDLRAILGLVQNLPDGMNLCEVGCWKGFTTAALCEVARVKKGHVWAVDHWKGNEGAWCEKVAKEKDIYMLFEHNLKSLGFWDMLTILKMDSVSASQQVENESLDFVFIDGDHRYKGVLDDINSWMPKLRYGGIMAGHDLEHHYWDLSDTLQEAYRTQLEVDFAGGAHMAITCALFDRFGKNYVMLYPATIWYIRKERENGD